MVATSSGRLAAASEVTVTSVPSTLSETVVAAAIFAAVRLAPAELVASIVIAVAAIDGAVWSSTVTVEVAEPPFPVESLAENVTVVLPRGNTVGALVVTATSPLTRSNAVPEVR